MDDMPYLLMHLPSSTTSLHLIGVCSWTQACTTSSLPTCSWICRPVIIRQLPSYIRSYPFCATSYPSPSSERTLCRFFLLVHQSSPFFPPFPTVIVLWHLYSTNACIPLSSSSLSHLSLHTPTLTPPSSETRALSLLFSSSSSSSCGNSTYLFVTLRLSTDLCCCVS